jgi:dihydroorotase
VGLETAFAVLYTDLVKTGILPLERLIALMAEAPRSRFDLDSDVGFTIFDLDTPYTVDPNTFLSQGKATPFAGKTVYGKCLMTVYEGRIVYKA